MFSFIAPLPDITCDSTQSTNKTVFVSVSLQVFI
uniref:Uncharacterized protein n=1 Tax=Anguilla anguilla TaxID=7936 RepID=A0A0E9P955_ANGAN